MDKTQVQKIEQQSVSKERLALYARLKEKYNPEGSKLRRYQLHLVDTLKEFDAFCRANGIVYYLAYGTLLGAIRHKGFIPWDDDVDLWMDRENYNKLEKLMKGEHHQLSDNVYVAMGIRPELWSPPFAYIDIFILDPSPDCKPLMWIKEWLCRWYYVMIKLRSRVDAKQDMGRFRKLLPLVPIARIHSTQTWKERYKAAAQLFMNAKSSYLQTYNAVMCDLSLRYPIHTFAEMRYAEFDGYEFPVPAGYDEVLRICYGDYMQVPDDAHIVVHGIVDHIDI